MPREKRGIQYAEAFRLRYTRLWNTGSPAFAGDDKEGRLDSAPANPEKAASNRLFQGIPMSAAALESTINTAFDAFMSLARTELKKLTDPAERLRRLAFLHLDALGSNRSMAVVFQMELRQSTRFLAEFSHHHMVEYLGLVREAITEGQASGIFRPGMSDKFAANCFFGALDEMVTSWVLSDHEYQLSNVADVVVDIFLNGMRTT